MKRIPKGRNWLREIQESRNPRVVEELLRSYLPSAIQIQLEDAPNQAAAAAEAGTEQQPEA